MIFHKSANSSSNIAKNLGGLNPTHFSGQSGWYTRNPDFQVPNPSLWNAYKNIWETMTVHNFDQF